MAYSNFNPMRDPGLPRFRWLHGAWPPLLVLGLSVVASVTLIGACMAVLSPGAEAAAGASAPTGTAQLPSASRNTRVRLASAG